VLPKISVSELSPFHRAQKNKATKHEDAAEYAADGKLTGRLEAERGRRRGGIAVDTQSASVTLLLWEPALSLKTMFDCWFAPLPPPRTV